MLSNRLVVDSARSRLAGTDFKLPYGAVSFKEMVLLSSCHFSKWSSADNLEALINPFYNYQSGVQFYHRQVQYIMNLNIQNK
jgi:hypothetical protein